MGTFSSRKCRCSLGNEKVGPERFFDADSGGIGIVAVGVKLYGAGFGHAVKSRDVDIGRRSFAGLVF